MPTALTRHPTRTLCCAVAAALAPWLTGCIAPDVTISPNQPRLRILGTAQDGGLPHVACYCPNCNRARRAPRFRRHVASLAMILPRNESSPRLYLIDATPDIRDQLDMLRDLRPPLAGRADRHPIDGVLVTHAHIGHYLGLAWFGFEALHTHEMPIWCTPRMADYLRTSGPWNQLINKHEITLHEAPIEKPVEFATGNANESVRVTPLSVPHRDEFSDTVGFVIRRTHRNGNQPGENCPTVFYVPDTEPWRNWQVPLPEIIAREHIDTLIVDGTFYSAGELPDRPPSSIGHPLMTDTLRLLEPLVRSGRLHVWFTHLNHSNPANDPASPAARMVELRGFHIAKEGVELPL